MQKAFPALLWVAVTVAPAMAGTTPVATTHPDYRPRSPFPIHWLVLGGAATYMLSKRPEKGAPSASALVAARRNVLLLRDLKLPDATFAADPTLCPTRRDPGGDGPEDERGGVHDDHRCLRGVLSGLVVREEPNDGHADVLLPGPGPATAHTRGARRCADLAPALLLRPSRVMRPTLLTLPGTAMPATAAAEQKAFEDQRSKTEAKAKPAAAEGKSKGKKKSKSKKAD